MSTKDLYERLESNRSGAARPAPRAPEAKTAEPKPGDTTRVNSGVVRRRAAPEPPPPPPAPAAPRTIRRPGARPDEPAPRVAAPEAPPAAATVRRPVAPPPASVLRKPAPPPVATPAPVAEEQVEASAPIEAAPVDTVESAPIVETVDAPEPAPVAEARAEEPAAPVAPAPVEEAPVVSAPTSERAVIVERPGGTTRLPSMPSLGSRAAEGRRLNQAPILPGLGLGVVALPAGYDPTDPTGARRRARGAPATGTRWGGGPGAGRPPGPGAARPSEPTPGAPGEDRRDKKAGRRGGRSEVSMAELDGGRMRRSKGKGKDSRAPQPQKVVSRKVRIEGEITVANLAHEFGVKAPELIKILMQLGTPATLNQTIDFDTATVLAQELGHEVVNVAFNETAHLIKSDEEDKDLITRPPVVTVMGHVDHGKTTLLDTIRKSKVAAGEAGGITQHIGAYQVRRGDRLVTFIDTPGHAAFSAMRARGAKVTDVVVLVVAADDGVMPQTVEAINHAKAASVPIVVAVNKCDKPGVNPDSIRRGLMEHGLVPEEYGGDTIFVNVSALKGTGIDDLLDNVLIVSEVQDLRANPNRHAEGVVLESRIEVGRGAVVTLLVKTGTLKQGDILVIGSTWGRVRAMSDERGAKIKEAGPSTPVEIFGLQDVPSAGDEFAVVGSEKDARTLSEHRSEAVRQGALSTRAKLTVDDLYKQGGAAQELMHVVLKTDVGGSLEALRAALEGITVSGTQLKILHAAIGPVAESDVTLGAANRALVVAFNVKADAKARQAADQFGVEIKRYDIIYQVIDDVKARLQGLLAPVYELQRVGEAEVRAVFNVSKSGPVAGCMVTDGRIPRGATAKVYREGKVVHEGKVVGLKRFKEDVREVVEGFECGVGIADYNDIAVGDRLEFSVQVEVKRPD